MTSNNTLNTNSTQISANSGIKFGNGASVINRADSLQSFTPTFTFLTPGNLSVIYTIQTGLYSIFGDYCYLSIHLKFVPTYTTSTGAARVASFPFMPPVNGTTQGFFIPISNNIAYPALRTKIFSQMSASTSEILLMADGPSSGATGLSVTQFTTGNTYEFYVFLTVLL